MIHTSLIFQFIVKLSGEWRPLSFPNRVEHVVILQVRVWAQVSQPSPACTWGTEVSVCPLWEDAGPGCFHNTQQSLARGPVDCPCLWVCPKQPLLPRSLFSVHLNPCLGLLRVLVLNRRGSDETLSQILSNHSLNSTLMVLTTITLWSLEVLW